jgi:hypothetical protein
MVIDLIEVLLNLSKSPIACQLHLNIYPHINLRVNRDLDTALYFHNSSRSEHHLPPNLVLFLRVAQIAGGDAPVLVVVREGVADVVEVPG